MKTFRDFILELDDDTLKRYQTVASKNAKELSDRADTERDILKSVKLRLKSINRYGNIIRAQNRENPATIPMKK